MRGLVRAKAVLVLILTVLLLAQPVSAAAASDAELLQALQEQVRELTARVEAVEQRMAIEESYTKQFAQGLAEKKAVDVPAIYEKVRPSVVGVLVELDDGESTSTGTGVISHTTSDRKTAQIVTNFHVVEDYERIWVILSDGRMLSAEFWAYDADADLCWLQVEGTDLPPAITWGEPDQVRIGEPVIVIGNPLGYRDSVSVGVLSGRGRSFDHNGYEFLQTDAAVNSGNSGGPLLDKDGNWIGVITVKRVGEGVEGLAFAYSLDAVRASIVVGNRSDGARAYFGAGLWQTTAVTMGVESDTGLLVVKLDPGGPLARAGVRQWDELLKVNEKRVSSLADIREIVDTTLSGTEVSVTYRRSGITYTTKVLLTGVAINMPKPILRYYTPILDSEGAF